jgi:hypothetical protein
MLFFSVRSGVTRPASQKYWATTIYLYQITQIFVCNFHTFAIFASVAVQTKDLSLHTAD